MTSSGVQVVVPVVATKRKKGTKQTHKIQAEQEQSTVSKREEKDHN